MITKDLTTKLTNILTYYVSMPFSISGLIKSSERVSNMLFILKIYNYGVVVTCEYYCIRIFVVNLSASMKCEGKCVRNVKFKPYSHHLHFNPFKN